ncbi:hypothetical protein PENTCL1PPCAC_30544, partial [Pristionchus entomophagus]
QVQDRLGDLPSTAFHIPSIPSTPAGPQSAEEKRRDIPRSAPIPPSRRRRHPKEAGETRDLAPSVLGCPLFLMSTSTFQASLPDHPIRLSCRLISSGNLDVMSLIMSFSCQL